MKKVIIERKVAEWDDLSAERQKMEIEKLSNEKYGLQTFFDDAMECYDYALHEIEKETLQEDPPKYKAVKFERDKLYWQSSSQVWYYDHCSPPDFLTYKDFCESTEQYTLELRQGYAYRHTGGRAAKYDFAFDWYLSITKDGITEEHTGEFTDIQRELENNGWDIPIEVIRLVKEHEEQFCKEFMELQKRVEDEIKAYDNYWPSDEEIAEYFRSNETEFIVEENEVRRIVS